MFSLTSSQVIFKVKIGFYFPDITLATEFPGSNVLLPTFSLGNKQDFQVANLPLAAVNFEPWNIVVCSRQVGTEIAFRRWWNAKHDMEVGSR